MSKKQHLVQQSLQASTACRQPCMTLQRQVTCETHPQMSHMTKADMYEIMLERTANNQNKVCEGHSQMSASVRAGAPAGPAACRRPRRLVPTAPDASAKAAVAAARTLMTGGGLSVGGGL